MRNCTSLETLPTSIHKLKSLEMLDLSHCSNFKSFLEILEPMEHLRELTLDGTRIEGLPSSIENLVGLHELSLSNCKSLEFVTESITNIHGLDYLNLYKCPKLQTMPSMALVDFFPETKLVLSSHNVSKIFDWHYSSSLLTLQDPSGLIAERITVTIRRVFNLIIFQAHSYATCQSTPQCNKSSSHFKIGQYNICGHCIFNDEERIVVISKLQPYFLHAATEFCSKELEICLFHVLLKINFGNHFSGNNQNSFVAAGIEIS